MNLEKNLILVKDEDKTTEISYCEYKNGKWQVQFRRGKVYSYHYLNVQWLRNPVKLNPETTVVYHNKQPLSGVDKIIDFGDYIRICFETGYNKVYRRHELTVEQSYLSNPDSYNCFQYLKLLAEIVSVKTEEEKSFLSKQYEKMSYVSPNSVLAKYLSKTELDAPEDGQMPIFPFGFNLSQKTATEKALTEQISVIEGPPGTGKTQTILNIIANAVINKKTVAVVSNNNAATANVLEKLQNYGVDFIAAYLGNKENKKNFVAEQTQTYPNMDTWVMNAARCNSLKDQLDESGSELKEMLKVKNKVALLKQERAALLVEEKHFHTYCYKTFTDILQIWFPDYTDTREGFWESLLYGLLEGACTALDIDRQDIDGTLYPYAGNPFSPALILLDDVPGAPAM